MTRVIVVSNETTILSDAAVARAVDALQLQQDRDFGPAWGIQIKYVFSNVAPPPRVERIHVLDDTDQADALGYHTVDRYHTPVGYVFAKTDLDNGEPWEPTLSHEGPEQAVDPYCDRVIRVKAWQGKGPAWLAEESNDPVENGVYMVNGVPMSNFVFPAWFRPNASGRVDFMGLLKTPLTLDHGGYQSFTRDGGRTWQEVFGKLTPKHQRKAPHKYSRRHLRQHAK